jgi:threonyl-tRNA synthetase
MLPFDQLAEPAESGPLLFDEDGMVLPDGVCLRMLVTELVTDRLRAYGAVPVERPPGTDMPSVRAADSLQTVFETGVPGREQPGPRLMSTVPHSDAFTELDEQIALVSSLLADLSVPFQPVCRVTPSVADEHREWLTELADRFQQPLLLERRADSDQPFRLEFAVLGTHSRLVSPAVWLADAADSRAVVRSTPLDDPTRFVAALCRSTAAADRPELPTWLAPIQFRLIPIDPGEIDACQRVADQLESSGVRVDIDDRELPVSDRLRTADQRWIPYDAVVGEEGGDGLRVTIRAEQTERAFTPAGLAERINEESADWPDSSRLRGRRYSNRADLLR